MRDLRAAKLTTVNQVVKEALIGADYPHGPYLGWFRYHVLGEYHKRIDRTAEKILAGLEGYSDSPAAKKLTAELERAAIRETEPLESIIQRYRDRQRAERERSE